MRQASAPPPDAMSCEVNESALAEPSDWFSRSYECSLVTPMYGGGVEPGEVDREMPIRASAIRGQLRFWWRMIFAHGLSHQEMRCREEGIWGGVGEAEPVASKVKVRVSKIGQLRLERPYTYPPDRNCPEQMKSWPETAPWANAYALFSAKGRVDTKNRREFEIEPKKLAREGLSFVLGIQISKALSDDQQNEVETTLRWWASFGGIGARTRRGVGAVHVESLRPISADEVKDVGGVLECLPAAKDAQSAWEKSIDRLRIFRQEVAVGRNNKAKDSKSPAGRSLWPEADALRKLSGNSSDRHANRLVHADVFPRAAFGLPIVFHFNNPKNDSAKDPGDHILEPSDLPDENKRDRMASPLILRPYWTGSAWLPAALLIPGWRAALVVDLKFKGQHDYTPRRWPDDQNEQRDFAERISPMKGRGTDPLSAFMAFFVEGK